MKVVLLSHQILTCLKNLNLSLQAQKLTCTTFIVSTKPKIKVYSFIKCKTVITCALRFWATKNKQI